MRATRFGASAAIITGLVLGGCGSSNSKLSYSAFSNAANMICSAATKQSNAASNASSSGALAEAATVGKIVSITEGGISKLKALHGPAALQAARDTYVADLNTVVSAGKTAEAALKAGNASAAPGVLKAIQSADGVAKSAGSKLGAPACSH